MSVHYYNSDFFLYTSNDDGHNHGRICVCVILMCPDRKKKKNIRTIILYRYIPTWSHSVVYIRETERACV